MQKLKEMIKPGDIVIVIILLLLSFLPFLIFYMNNASNDAENNIATISVDGEVIETFTLADDGETEVYEYADEHGHENKIVRTGNEITISYANCVDQLCVRQGSVSKVGETLVCLPHKLIVEVSNDNPENIENNNDIDIVS